MLDFFVEGGWGMWPILIFGMVTVGAAVRFVQKPELNQLRFVGGMGLTTLVSTIHATWTCFGAVFNAVGNPEVIPEHQVTRVLLVGLKESTRPGSMGGLLLTLACLLTAVGLLRLRPAKASSGAGAAIDA